MSKTTSDPFDLRGCGVGLTGAGGHLGRGMACALVARGADVLLIGRTRDSLEATAEVAVGPGRTAIEVADATSAEGVEAALDHLESFAGNVRGWVNNAYAGAGGRLLDVTQQDVSRTLESALGGVLLCVQRVSRRMISTGSPGSIVNVASMYGVVSPQPAAYAEHPQFHNPPAYGAAKAGVIQLTRYAACELASENIRVNALSPGAFPNPVVQQESGFIQELERRIPLQRIGRPAELGGPLVFLLSDASSYMTGQNLVVDGGWTAW